MKLVKMKSFYSGLGTKSDDQSFYKRKIWTPVHTHGAKTAVYTARSPSNPVLTALRSAIKSVL